MGDLPCRTHSAAALGLIGLVQIIPFACAIFAGGICIVDRFNRKRLVLMARSLRRACARFYLRWRRCTVDSLPAGVLDWMNGCLDSFKRIGWGIRARGVSRPLHSVDVWDFVAAGGGAGDCAAGRGVRCCLRLCRRGFFPEPRCDGIRRRLRRADITGPLLAGAGIFVVEDVLSGVAMEVRGDLFLHIAERAGDGVDIFFADWV